ncbi:hypothetical protein JQ634_16005 [Bradyrhizobium sp. AUGA SZCCT0240]|uniref:hypothetical protein n=1 Tax=Bradyrhizobium sp. AUGA SZCCT0240 TaxID=2807669 RepID=UPI001BABE5DE|nr:hypothetical protein [Bradyrhizobium sp. AUGA SZCCT0240]MBR1255200.1 hypothetical protein [Bradyrhizobium sp. AUGA SZCCT0240]
MASPTAPGGIKKKKGGGEMTVPEFAMPPDAVPGIAQVIVDAWNNDASLDKIFERYPSGAYKGMATKDAADQATAAINAAAPKFNLQRAVIISEEEHDNGYTMQFEYDVVFVLPNPDRADLNGANLLNTAKLLMACTPNGI